MQIQQTGRGLVRPGRATACAAEGGNLHPASSRRDCGRAGRCRAGTQRRAGPPGAMPAAVVEYKGWKEGYRCGYCASERGKVSAGKREEVGRDGAARAPVVGAAPGGGVARPPSLKMGEVAGACGEAAAAARGKHGGAAVSCGRCPCPAHSKDGGGGCFRSPRGAV